MKDRLSDSSSTITKKEEENGENSEDLSGALEVDNA